MLRASISLIYNVVLLKVHVFTANKGGGGGCMNKCIALQKDGCF